MLVPPPRSLKMDRRALLRDVRARLADRLPAYAEREPDPTDPGWLLLGEAAWMVELLSEQLDRAPLASLQHLVRLMGGHMLPATPALAAVVMATREAGLLSLPSSEPDQLSLFSRPDERAGPIEFVPVERELWLQDARLGPLALVRGGQLYHCGRPWEQPDMGGLGAWAETPSRSPLFDDERASFTVAAANPQHVVDLFRGAIAEVERVGLGWLGLEVLPPQGERVTLVARVDPSRAFRRAAQGGLWAGGDLEADWRPLPSLAWSPPVQIVADPRLPSELHGVAPRPLPSGEGFLIRDVPEGFPLDRLLVRGPSPTPRAALDAIWQLVTHANTELLNLKPLTSRAFGSGAETITATWVKAALVSGQWAQIARRGEWCVVPALLARPASEGERLRFGVFLHTERAGGAVELECWTWGAESRLARRETPERCLWRLSGAPSRPPDRRGEPLELVTYELPLSAGERGVLVAVSGRLAGACLNPALVVNAPAVRDGRLWTIQRNVPEPVSLLFQDLVTTEVVERMQEQPIHDETMGRLRTLPLARFTVEDLDGRRDWIQDLEGVGADASEGRIMLNAPDAQGRERTLRAGARVRLDWYRRTDGASGRVGAGTIRQHSQPGGMKPAILRVHNPLGAELGADRERSEDAVERLFGPGELIPTLPDDFERLARQTLGPRADGWLVRCWTYAERTLLQHALWPLVRPMSEAADPETMALRSALSGAGPDKVVFAIGLPEGELSEEDLRWARERIEHRLRRLGGRLPAVSGAIVTRCWALHLRIPVAASEPAFLPTYATDRLMGELVDARGRAAHCPANTLLLNAAIVGTRREA